jgi:hypothetical protein
MVNKNMKTTTTTLILVLIATVLDAQNFAVRRLNDDGRHEFHAVPGCPLDWPVAVDNIGTNTVSPWANRVVMSKGELEDVYRSSVGNAFTNWHQTAWHSYRTNHAALVESERRTVINEIRQLQAQCRQDHDNWTNLTSGQKLEALRKVMRLMELKEQDGR